MSACVNASRLIATMAVRADGERRPEETDMRPTQPVLGVALIVGSVFLMSFGDALIKLQQRQLHGLADLRAALADRPAVLLCSACGCWHPAIHCCRDRRGWVGLRSALLVLMWIAYYAALPLISLSAAAVAFYTAPLFIALLSRPLTGEPVGPTRWLGIVLGFAGRPDRAAARCGDTFSPAALLPVLAALLYALAAIVTRARCADERPLVAGARASISACSLAGAAGDRGSVAGPPRPPSACGPPVPVRPLGRRWASRDWALMAAAGAADGGFGTGVAMAYQIAPAAADRHLRLHLRRVRRGLELPAVRRAAGCASPSSGWC